MFYRMSTAPILLVATGGTIEKTYDELHGILSNKVRVLDVMLASLQLNGIEIERLALMNKDSMDMTPEDHVLIAETVRQNMDRVAGIVIVHGTDRLAVTGDIVVKELGTPAVPVVLTGAMRPWELRQTDAMQNLTEALLAVQLVKPGVYLAMHNQVLAFPGVRKDASKGTFVPATSGDGDEFA